MAKAPTREPTESPAIADTPRTLPIADPMPIAFGLFAFALAVYGIRFVNVDVTTVTAGPVTIGLDYATLVGAIAESVAGVLGIIRGDGYAAYVVSTFGIWLLGFYFLITAGAANKAFTPNALAWYVLVLIVPVAIMAVPAIVERNYPFVIAFGALLLLQLMLGLGYHEVYRQVTAAAKDKGTPDLSTAVDLLRVSAYAGFVAAAALWYVFAREVYRITGVLKSPDNP